MEAPAEVGDSAAVCRFLPGRLPSRALGSGRGLHRDPWGASDAGGGVLRVLQTGDQATKSVRCLSRSLRLSPRR